jgi:hypothetical protein
MIDTGQTGAVQFAIPAVRCTGIYMPECHYKRLVQDRDQLEHVIPDNPEDIPVPCLTCHSVGTDHSGGVLSKQYYYHSEALRLFRDIQFHL